MGKSLGVICRSCGSEFEPIFDNNTQAIDCACHYGAGEISGHYGSRRFDMMRGVVRNPRPEWLREGTICDDCVQELHDANWIVWDSQKHL